VFLIKVIKLSDRVELLGSMTNLLGHITNQLRKTSLTKSLRTTPNISCRTSTWTIHTNSLSTTAGRISNSEVSTLSLYQNQANLKNNAISSSSTLITGSLPQKSRPFSTAAAATDGNSKLETVKDDGSVIAVGPNGDKYSIPLYPLGYHKRSGNYAPKLQPFIKNNRIAQLRTIEGKKRSIRHSPWRLNLVCQFAAGQTVPDALLQLRYCEKSRAPLVAKVIKEAANTAKQKYGLEMSQLEVAECFATHGQHLKRIKTMGRGRSGRMKHRFSHMRLVLREIDFPLKIVTSTTKGKRQQWIKKMEIALEEKARNDQERAELEELEKEFEEMKKAKESKS